MTAALRTFMPRLGLDLDSGESDDDDVISDPEDDDPLPPSKFPTSKNSGNRTDRLRAALPGDDEKIADIVEKALANLALCGLNVALLLELMSWSSAACTVRQRIKTERTDLMHYDRLGPMLDIWCLPPRPPSGGKRAQGARDALELWAFSCVERIVEHDLHRVIGPIVRPPSSPVSSEMLLAVDLKEVALKMATGAARTWKLIMRMVYTRKQERRNSHKDPSAVHRAPSHSFFID